MKHSEEIEKLIFNIKNNKCNICNNCGLKIKEDDNDGDELFELSISKNIEYRMYSIVLRQLSPIQKGIQSAHSIIEYSNIFSNNEDYKRWSKKDKTIILLDASDVNDMNNVIFKLISQNINFSTFVEPSLENIITSISFIAENTIYENIKEEYLDTCLNNKQIELLNIIKTHKLSF